MKLINTIKALKRISRLPNPEVGPTVGALPNWSKLIAASGRLWPDALKKAEGGPGVLIATSVGGQAAVTILESLLGVALTLRGARVKFLLCDGVLPACLQVHIGKIKDLSIITEYKLNEKVCPGCLGKGKKLYAQTQLPVLFYGDLITPREKQEIRQMAHAIPIDEIKNYTRDGFSIGEHATAGALRFLSRGQLPEDPQSQDILRRYFESALITVQVIMNLYQQNSIEAAVFNHGIYVPQGIIGEVSRSLQKRVANWQVAYRKKCFIFSHHHTYHHTLLNEPVSNWKNIAWSKKLETLTMDYLNSRRFGTQDWIWFHDQPKHELKEIVRELNIDFKKPTVILLTNVFWDAQLHYKANAFKDMLDWLIQSIDYFKQRPDIQAVIRIHPAEIRGAIPSRQPLKEELANRYPQLPANIFIVPPESQISTYTLCENSDSVIIYGTKTGVETTAIGIPVIVAGEAWVRNKGLTIDVDSPAAYRKILDTLPLRKRMEKKDIQTARKYAFHFFFRRFVPLGFLNPCSGGIPYEIKIDNLEALLPGQDKGLDVLCDGFLTGSEFIYPAEDYLQ